MAPFLRAQRRAAAADWGAVSRHIMTQHDQRSIILIAFIGCSDCGDEEELSDYLDFADIGMKVLDA